MRCTYLPLALTLVFLYSPTASADSRSSGNSESSRDYTHMGFQVYTGYGGAGFSIDSPAYDHLDDNSGNWGSFLLGFNLGLHHNFAFIWEADVSIYSMDGKHFTGGAGSIGVKVTPIVGPSHHTQPYLQIGAGASELYSYNDLFLGAPKLSLGVSHFVGRRAALFAVGSLTFSHMDHRGEELSITNEFNVVHGTMHFGLQFRVY